MGKTEIKKVFDFNVIVFNVIKLHLNTIKKDINEKKKKNQD